MKHKYHISKNKISKIFKNRTDKMSGNKQKLLGESLGLLDSIDEKPDIEAAASPVNLSGSGKANGTPGKN